MEERQMKTPQWLRATTNGPWNSHLYYRVVFIGHLSTCRQKASDTDEKCMILNKAFVYNCLWNISVCSHSLRSWNIMLVLLAGSSLAEMVITLMNLFFSYFESGWFSAGGFQVPLLLFWQRSGKLFSLYYMLTPMSASASASSLPLLAIICEIQPRKEQVRSYIKWQNHVCRTGKCNKWQNLFIYFGVLDS